MTWQIVDKRYVGGNSVYGRDWSRLPACSVNVVGGRFNEPAVAAFGLSDGVFVQVLIDCENRRVGFKILDKQEGRSHGFLLRQDRSGAKALEFACKAICQAFPDARRCAYRLHLNSGERVIQMTLDEAERLSM